MQVEAQGGPRGSGAPRPAWAGGALALVRWVDALNRGVWRAVTWVTLVMVLVGAYNALARTFDQAVAWRLSSNAWVELQWYLFSLVFLLGAPWALRLGAHVRVDVVYGRFSPRAKAWVDLVGGLLLLLPFAVFAVGIAWPSVRDSFAVREVSPDPGGLWRWPIKAVLPLAFLLLALQGLAEVLRRGLWLAGHGTDEELGLAEPADGGDAAGGRPPA